jgi:CRISPR system Cascade subunit CasD
MAEPGVLLQLTGPMQSWGSKSRFTQRDTEPYPTRSGVIGMIAAALGWDRDADLRPLDSVQLAVRRDRAGRRLRDFHTVGGGLPREATVPTAEGKRRPGLTTTVVSERYYLADAAFTVAVLAEDALLREIEMAMRHPRWPLSLGRRSCPPEGPLVIGTFTDAIAALERLPLARPEPARAKEDTLRIDFTADHPAVADAVRVSDLQDWPENFSSRTYRSRPVYQWTRQLAISQCAGYGATYLGRLRDFLDAEEHA